MGSASRLPDGCWSPNEKRIRKLPRKIREINNLKTAGFTESGGAGKGSHRKFTHEKYPGAVTISGKSGDDVKHYQVKQVDQAIERVKQ